MEKKELKLDPVHDVPLCYARFFDKKTPPPPPQSPGPDSDLNSDPKPHTDQKIPVITIQTTKEKNKDCTVATFPNSIKLSDADLKKFTSYLPKRFQSRANYKKNPLKITISGTKPNELKDEILSFFELENVQFEFILSKIKVKENFQVYLMPLDDGVEVSWKQHGSPKNLEDEFEKLVAESWETTISNNSTHKEARFTIQGDFSEAIHDYFINKYTMQERQIITINSEHKEPNYNPEVVIDYPKPLSLIEKFNNGKKTYFSELSSTIFDLITAQRDRYSRKTFNNNLEFTRIGPDKKGKIKWTTIINPRKRFSKSSILNSHSLNVGDKAIVTYRDNKTIRGYIIEIDQETALITAKFLLNSNEKPPGFDEELPEIQNKDSSDYDDDEEEETNDKENEDYKKFLKDNNIIIHDDKNDEDEEKTDEKQEEDRIIKIFEQTEEMLIDNKNDNEEEDINDNYIENDDGLYTIYFEKSEAFFEKCAKALLSLYDSHSEIKSIITKNDRYDDQNRTDMKISVQNAKIDLTESPFLTKQQKQDQVFLTKLQIIPSREQKKSIEMILSNKISIVHGPPGTGKTFSLSLFVYHLLTRLKEDEKQRILLCAKNDEDVSHIVKFVSPIVRALGRKIVWVSYQGFDSEKQFEEATDEEKELISYQIMKRKTVEAEIYQNIQKEKWDYNERVRRAKKNHINDIPKFPSKKLTKMNEIRSTIEKNLVHESDVVCCTISTSAKYSISDIIFESVFIDDAQQVNQLNSIIPLIHQPNKFVLLGDSKQLKSFTNPKIKRKHPSSTKSLYKKLMKKRVPSQYLNTQYRMHPTILSFPNKQFYSGTVYSDSNVESKTKYDLPFIQTPIIFVDVRNGKEFMRKQDNSFVINNLECFTVHKIVSNLKICLIKGKEVGVMTPYYSQATKLNRILSPLKYKGLKVSTIENFQGDERDFIILSLVRTKEGNVEYQPDKKTLNVALTRARKGMIIVGSFELFSNLKGEDNQHLVNLCEFYNKRDQDSSTVSVINDASIELLRHFVQKPVKKPVIVNIPKKEKPKNEEKPNEEFDYVDDDKKEEKHKKEEKPNEEKLKSTMEKIDDILNGDDNSNDDNDDGNFEYDDSSYDDIEDDFEDDDDFDFDDD